MFERITIELTKEDLTALIKEKVKAEFGQHCNVTFDTMDIWSGYGQNEAKTVTFKGATVTLIPKNASNQPPL